MLLRATRTKTLNLIQLVKRRKERAAARDIALTSENENKTRARGRDSRIKVVVGVTQISILLFCPGQLRSQKVKMAWTRFALVFLLCQLVLLVNCDELNSATSVLNTYQVETTQILNRLNGADNKKYAYKSVNVLEEQTKVFIFRRSVVLQLKMNVLLCRRTTKRIQRWKSKLNALKSKQNAQRTI